MEIVGDIDIGQETLITSNNADRYIPAANDENQAQIEQDLRENLYADFGDQVDDLDDQQSEYSSGEASQSLLRC